MSRGLDLTNNDAKYFIDGHVYNCPFCKRRNVKYKLVRAGDFDWSDKGKAYDYIVRCTESACGKESFHLSYNPIVSHTDGNHRQFAFPPEVFKMPGVSNVGVGT